MTVHQALEPQVPDPKPGGVIKLAVMAVGGQGGGVVAGWIEDLARAGGYACQATSVAGVAQRTGATVYYIEMCPKTDRQPIFSLMPAAGDVDILIASEMMEVGRSILRGFVTPDRTTLIGSTHRALAVSEKMVPGDGIANAAEVVVDSRRICIELDRTNPGAAGSLMPSHLRARIEKEMSIVDELPNYQILAVGVGKVGPTGLKNGFAVGKVARCDALLAAHAGEAALCDAYSAKRSKEQMAADQLFDANAMERAHVAMAKALRGLEARLAVSDGGVFETAGTMTIGGR